MLNENEVVDILKQESIYGFVRLNKLMNEKNNPIDWVRHKFLFDIYDDWSPVQACIKASQIGFSTMVILKALFAARNKKYNIIYTLPTGGDVNEFVSSKVNKIIDNNYALQQLVKDKDTIFQKQLGDSVIFFKGTATGKSAERKTESHTGIMITSDLNIHDESDRSDQVIMEQFESRLDFSDYKGRWYFSNPTVPQVGANKYFLLSDQKHWFHRCSKCNKRFFLEWTDSCIDRDKEIYLCPKCHQPLSDEDRNKGEWIQKYRNKDISGYWINQMMASWKSCADLLRKEKESSKGHFMNFCLGLPYIGSDMVVNREIIVNNIVLTDNKKKNVAIGVDNGVIKHYVIGNEEGIFAIGKTKDWDEIERLRNLYDAKMVIDALPYPRRPKELSEKYKFKIFLNFYKRDKDDLKTIRWGERQNHNLVYSDRTKIFDEVIAQLVAGKIVFNLTVYQLEEFIEHWERMYLAKTVDSMGLERMSWESSSDEDHYSHATIYFYLALQKTKQRDDNEVIKNFPQPKPEYSPVVKDGFVEGIDTDIDCFI